MCFDVLCPTEACAFLTSELPKVLRILRLVFNILTWNRASRHNRAHFSNIWTSKSGQKWCVLYVDFHLDMHVLPATTVYTFSTPQVVREWCGLFIHCMLTLKCSSRRSGVRFFISHLATWLHTRGFSEPTLSTLMTPKSLQKHTVWRLS